MGSQEETPRDRLKFGAENPLKVKRWVRSGELPNDLTDVGQVYAAAGRLLDAACSHDILGTVLFEGEDGKYYTLTVEAVLGEASPEFVRETLDEQADDAQYGELISQSAPMPERDPKQTFRDYIYELRDWFVRLVDKEPKHLGLDAKLSAEFAELERSALAGDHTKLPLSGQRRQFLGMDVYEDCPRLYISDAPPPPKPLWPNPQQPGYNARSYALDLVKWFMLHSEDCEKPTYLGLTAATEQALRAEGPDNGFGTPEAPLRPDSWVGIVHLLFDQPTDYVGLKPPETPK